MIIFLLRNGNLLITILFIVTKNVYEFPQKRKRKKKNIYVITLFVCMFAVTLFKILSWQYICK